MKKFELDYSSSTTYRGRTLFRIKALKNFTTSSGENIYKGDLGGYVQSEKNLDQNGTSWIFKGAIAMDDARVLNNAQLHHDALIKDKAIIKDKASAHNNVKITGHTCVSQEAVITRNAQITNHATVHGKAFVTGDAIVSGFATIADKAQIQEQATIKGHAFVGHQATISDYAKINDNAHVTGNAYINDHANICDYTRIEGHANISSYATICDYAVIKGHTHVSDELVISDHTILDLPENAKPITSPKDYATFKGFNNTYITYIVDTQTWLQSDKNKRILFDGDTKTFIDYGYTHNKTWGDCYKSYTAIVKELEPKKFELDKSSKISVDGVTLYRIRALKDFGVVKKGDLGGYVEKEENLRQKDNAWIFDNAKAMDDAIVKDNATLHHNATVCDDAIISGSASINGHAFVSDQASVSDNAILYGNVGLFDNAKIYGKAHLYDHVVVSGNAQIYDNAHCHQSAKIENNAQIFNDATITNAFISGSTCIFDKATVKDNAIISGHVNLYGNITVFGQTYIDSVDDIMLRSNDDYMVLKHWSNNDMITYIKPADYWMSPTFNCSTEDLKSYAKNKPNKHKILAYIDFVTNALK